jgi:hypothetical protein
MYPYETIQALAKGLYTVKGTLGRSPLGRRMTVVVLPGGRLAVHSPIRMSDPDMAALDALGPVGFILVPNASHTTDAPWYGARYPQAALLVPRPTVPRLAKRMRIDGTLEDDWGDEPNAGLERLAVGGTAMHEVIFLHRASRTLILTDLVFNLGTDFHGLARLFMKLNQAYGRFGVTRLGRWVFLRDKPALWASLQPLETWDFDRVVVGHGDVLETGGKAELRRALAFLSPGGAGRA